MIFYPAKHHLLFDEDLGMCVRKTGRNVNLASISTAEGWLFYSMSHCSSVVWT